jgi:Flp pilus assembly pilin Flp
MRRFLHEENGAVSLEYGLIACLLVLGTIPWITQIGQLAQNLLSLALPALAGGGN